MKQDLNFEEYKENGNKNCIVYLCWFLPRNNRADKQNINGKNSFRLTYKAYMSADNIQ